MIYFNNDIKKINYQGYDITKVYACGGELVWSADVSYKFIANYSGGETYSKVCDGSSVLGIWDTQYNGYEASAMTSAIVGDCITDIQLAFANCYALEEVVLPSGLTTIGDNSFQCCHSLSSITIPSNVTTIGNDAFTRCSGLTSIDIPDSVAQIGDNAFGGTFGVSYPLTSVTIGSGIVSIGNNAFRFYDNLTSITVKATTPPALGTNVFNDTNDCPIYVPCKSVDSYKSSWYTYASRIEAIPYSCSKLVYTADGNTYSIDCDNTTVLGENYEVFRNISNNGTRVSAVTDAIIGTCVESIYPNTFNRFTNLSSVTLTENVTTIGASAFFQCYNLSRINLPQSLTTIGGTAFEDCWNLSAVTIPSGVTRIEVETFEDCNRLRTIILPSTIEYIGQFAFSIQDTSDATEKAAKIETARSRVVYIYATTPPEISSADVFESHIPNVPATYAIYVPTQSVEAYRTAEHWKDMNDVTRIQAMP